MSFTLTVENYEDILNEKIFINSLICRLNRLIIDKWKDNTSIQRILDIVNPKAGCFLTFNELPTDITQGWDHLFYYGTLAAIPRLWKVELRNIHLDKVLDHESKTFGLVSKNGSLSKQLY